MTTLATQASLSSSKSHRIVLGAMITAFLACSAYDAMAANARSYQGTVTNNQTYNAGNPYDHSSAERSNVHLRPLAIDADRNPEAERWTSTSTTVVTPNTPPHTYVVAPEGNAAIVGKTRVYNMEPSYHAPSGTVTTTTHTAPNWTDPADVNARPDAGVVISYPVLPRADATVVTTQQRAVIGGY